MTSTCERISERNLPLSNIETTYSISGECKSRFNARNTIKPWMNWMNIHLRRDSKMLLLLCTALPLPIVLSMMTWSTGKIFSVTGPLWWESTSHWCILLKKASDVELWYFLCARTNGYANNRGAGKFRRHRAHHDVTVMPCRLKKWH